jgi:hypothetical protein
MSRKHSTALGIGAAMGGAAVATFLSMGMAHADDSLVPDGWSDLFGSSGPQAADDASLDHQMFLANPGEAASFDQAVDTFESQGLDHGITQLINAVDPSAFTVQFDPDIQGYLLTPAADAGGYLVPDDFLGYLATDLDFFALNPLGLDPVLLGPLIDTLLGFPASFT